jgi:hypothetical protein
VLMFQIQLQNPITQATATKANAGLLHSPWARTGAALTAHSVEYAKRIYICHSSDQI